MQRALMFCCVLITLMLSGCGFHLRQDHILDQRFTKLYLNTPSPYSNFTRELKDALHHNGVTVVERPNQAPLGLYISAFKISYDPPTIGNSSTSRVYRYYLLLDFQLKTASGTSVGPLQHIVASRFTTLNAGMLSETNNQIYLVELGLIHDTIRQMLHRMAFSPVKR